MAHKMRLCAFDLYVRLYDVEMFSGRATPKLKRLFQANPHMPPNPPVYGSTELITLQHHVPSATIEQLDFIKVYFAFHITE